MCPYDRAFQVPPKAFDCVDGRAGCIVNVLLMAVVHRVVAVSERGEATIGGVFVSVDGGRAFDRRADDGEARCRCGSSGQPA